MNNLYKIGEFSKIVNLPIKTLRYYDEYGLLEPSYVDEFTGYRYYNDTNISECKLIILLKSLDFTLEEISNCKDNLTSEVIATKRKELNDKIDLLTKKQKRLMIIEQELSSVKDNSQNIQTNKPKVLVLTPNKDNNIAA